MCSSQCSPPLSYVSLTRSWWWGYHVSPHCAASLFTITCLPFVGNTRHWGFAMPEHLSLPGPSRCTLFFLHWHLGWLHEVSKNWECYIESIKSSNADWVPVALPCTRIWGWAQAVGKHLRAVKIHHCCKSWMLGCFPQHYTDVPHILRAIALHACCLWE